MSFHKNVRENEDFNQYWYSKKTAEALIGELFDQATLQSQELKVAFLSTPSLFFSLDSLWSDRAAGGPLQIKAVLFDFDESLGKKAGSSFHKYDFRDPLSVPTEHIGTFDCVVIDPPFITEEVWRAYAQTSKALLKSIDDENVEASNSPTRRSVSSSETGMFIGTSVIENADILKQLFNAQVVPFMPSIPTLVYQYNTFTNFAVSGPLNRVNPEIPQ